MAVTDLRPLATGLLRSALRIAVTIVLGGCVGACAVDPSTSKQLVRKETVYVNVWHTFQSTLTDSIWNRRKLPAAERDVDGYENERGWEEINSLAVDCSDARVSCTDDGVHVIAVPKSGLSQQPYEARGVRFRVEKCIRGRPDGCSVALVSGTCDQMSEVMANDEVHCLPSPPESPGRSTNVAYVMYFVYNEDVGVTAYGIAPAPVQGEAEQLAIVTQSVLVSERGLLCCRPLADVTN